MGNRRAINTFLLNDREIALLMRPMLGAGGFNSAGRHIQQIIQPSGKISLTDCECGEIMRIARYALRTGGDGGVETRMRLGFGRHLGVPWVCEQRSLDPSLF